MSQFLSLDFILPRNVGEMTKKCKYVWDFHANLSVGDYKWTEWLETTFYVMAKKRVTKKIYWNKKRIAETFLLEIKKKKKSFQK